MDTSKSTACSPVKTGGSKALYKSIGFNTPQHAKATLSTLTMSPQGKRTATASFFKPFTSTNNKVQKAPASKDISIVHESKIFKNLLEKNSARKNDVLKRNPILQDNNEAVHEFKSSIRRLASADAMSPCKDEVITRSKATGEFNYIYNPPSLDPKPQGIRSFTPIISECSDENVRRLRKDARPKSEYRRNPLTEGDGDSPVVRRVRKAVEESDEHKKLNDKKYLLAAERGCSQRGKVFRDQNCTVVGTDYSLVGSQTERSTFSPQRPLSSQEQKMRGTIKGVLEYHDSPKFREQGVTGKINTVKFEDLVAGHDSERIFARKTTLGI